MENASKALLIAGGVLMGVLLLSGLVMFWSRLSQVQSGSSDTDKDSQLAQFNQEFETYNKDKVLGSEIISIVNKIDSYNHDIPSIFNSKVQYEEIKVTVNFGSQLGDTFKDSVEDLTKSYRINEMIKKYTELEGKYSRDFVQKLSANVQRIEDTIKDIKNSEGRTTVPYSEVIERIFGRKGVTEFDKITLEKYKEFTNFKKAKFKCTGTEHNENGQINKLSFTFTSV